MDMGGGTGIDPDKGPPIRTTSGFDPWNAGASTDPWEAGSIIDPWG